MASRIRMPAWLIFLLFVSSAVMYVVGCKKNPETTVLQNETSSANSNDDTKTDHRGVMNDKNEDIQSKGNDVSQGEPPIPMEIDLPTPPTGFSWKYCKEIKGALLFPDNWYWKKMITSNEIAYYITKESIDENGFFNTGLTFIVLRDIPAKSKMSPSKYALEFIDVATKQRQSLNQWQNNIGPFKGYGCLLRDAKQGAGTVILHNLLIANDKTGTLYLVLFESPESNWEKEWKIGEVILARLYIDDAI